MEIIQELREKQELLRGCEVKAILRVDKKMIARLVAEGKLKAYRVGARWRYDPRSLADMLEASNG